MKSVDSAMEGDGLSAVMTLAPVSLTGTAAYVFDNIVITYLERFE